MPTRILLILALLHCLFGDVVRGSTSDVSGGEKHWAFRELRKVAIPPVRNTEWPRNPIDNFILARLEKAGIAPSEPADVRSLIRRAYFDLIGLPPTFNQVERFSREAEPGRFEGLVEYLLSLPLYGEHWARHWLDVVHYADTHGNDHDYARFNAWPYRDYVINAFNSDKTYTRFIQEQIAGDVLFPQIPEATVALGFLAAGPWDDTLMVTVREDTVDHRMSQVLDRDNMVTTVMSTFQSLTVHCARCHNHKFDPVSQREYYSLQAVFAGVDRADRPYDRDPAVHARRQQLRERKWAITARQQGVMQSLQEADVRRKVAEISQETSAWNALWSPLDIVSVASANGDSGVVFARQADGSWFATGARPERDTYIVTGQTTLENIRAIRLEVLPDDRLPQRGPGRYENGNFHLSEIRAWVHPSRGESHGGEPVQFERAMVDHSGDGQGGPGLIDGKPQTYWSVHPRYGEAHSAVLELRKAPGSSAGSTFTIRLEHEEMKGHQIGRFRLWVSNDENATKIPSPLPANIAQLLRKPDAERSASDYETLALYALGAEVERDLAQLPPPKMVYAATRDFAPSGSFKPSLEPRPVHLLIRGDINRPGEAVGPGTLDCLAGLSADFGLSGNESEGERRAALVQWLTDRKNVLTWRSIVNRVWQYHFGRGLVDTPNDFGKMGSSLSHPELLDWLALWFRDEARGSLKALHTLIMSSATWRQSSMARQGEQIDSENRLLWRQNRTRLTAEEVRDTMLSLSGQIESTMGGPAVIQFLHRDKATFNTDGAPPYLDYGNFDPDSPAARRRAIYRFLFRTVPDPLMDTLDCPDGSVLVPVRSVSTTALQALAMMNDHFLIRQCEHLANRLAREAKTPRAQVRILFQTMLQRPPNAVELDRIAGYAERHGLTNACHLLLNGNEFIYLD